MMSLSLAIAGLGLTACNQVEEGVDAAQIAQIVSVGDNGETILDIKNLQDGYAVKSGNITEEIADWLIFMREEEKVAHDLYLAFNEIYNYRIFQNITKAESNHMAVILTYLDEYELDDPASSDPGVFVNEDLQKLYDDLLEKGKISSSDALKVGALVEEVDIIDLAEVYSWEPGEDIIALAEALMLGSRNHLRAYTRVLGFRDIDYVPEVMSVEDFESIVNSPWERGTGLCRNIDTEAGTSFGYASGQGYCRWIDSDD